MIELDPYTRKENERLADVLLRDAEHVSTLRAIVANATMGLHHVAASNGTRTASGIGQQFVRELTLLEADLRRRSVEYRKMAIPNAVTS